MLTTIKGRARRKWSNAESSFGISNSVSLQILNRAEARDLWRGDKHLVDGFQRRPVDIVCCGIGHLSLREYKEHTNAEHSIDELGDQDDRGDR